MIGIAIGAGSASNDTGTQTTSAVSTAPATVTLTETATVTVTVTTTAPAATPTRATRPAKVTTPTTTPAPPPPTHKPAKTVHVVGVPAAALPIASLTPGVVLTTSAAVVCVSGYSSSVRDVPDSEKEAVYARYGIPHVPYAHEVDHLISLELGGSNAITNLWPEPYAGRWGARTKDALENRLHELVCAGSLDLRTAQHIEATNWVAAYRTYVGAPPNPLPAPTPSAPPPTRTTAPAGNCEPGYTPCLPRVYDLDCGEIDDSLKPIRVTGSDPYGLDADGDGYGCDV